MSTQGSQKIQLMAVSCSQACQLKCTGGDGCKCHANLWQLWTWLSAPVLCSDSPRRRRSPASQSVAGRSPGRCPGCAGGLRKDSTCTRRPAHSLRALQLPPLSHRRPGQCLDSAAQSRMRTPARANGTPCRHVLHLSAASRCLRDSLPVMATARPQCSLPQDDHLCAHGKV